MTRVSYHRLGEGVNLRGSQPLGGAADVGLRFLRGMGYAPVDTMGMTTRRGKA